MDYHGQGVTPLIYPQVQQNRPALTGAPVISPQMETLMNDKTNTGFDDLQTVDVEVERGGKTRIFTVRELSGAEASHVFNTSKANGKRDPMKARKVDSFLIEKSVTEKLESGEVRNFTFDQAQAMGMALRRALLKAALEVNGLNDDDDAEKN